MPLRFVSIESADLYSDSAGGEVLASLPLGTRIDVETFQQERHGRVRARNGVVEGWIDPGQLTASGLGLLAGARRSGVALPENAPLARPAGVAQSGSETLPTGSSSDQASQLTPMATEARAQSWDVPERPSVVGPSERDRDPDSMFVEAARVLCVLFGLAMFVFGIRIGGTFMYMITVASIVCIVVAFYSMRVPRR